MHKFRQQCPASAVVPLPPPVHEPRFKPVILKIIMLKLLIVVVSALLVSVAGAVVQFSMCAHTDTLPEGRHLPPPTLLPRRSGYPKQL
jgi:hypothetical protein